MGKLTKLALFVLLMICAFLGGAFGGQVKEIIAAKSEVSEVVRARKFVVVNAQGKEMAIMQVEKDKYPSILLKFSDGKPMFVVGNDPAYGSLISLTGESGINRFTVQADMRRDSRIVLTGNNTHISMGTKEKENLVKLSTFRGEGAGLFMQGSTGGYVVHLTANKREESQFALLGGGDANHIFRLEATKKGLRVKVEEMRNKLELTGGELIDKLEKIK